MNILMISSDKAVAGGASVGNAIERVRQYGRQVDFLDIIVYTGRQDKLSADFHISENTTGIPSNSKSKFFFFFDAIKIFQRINREHRIDLVVCQDPFVFGLIGWWLKRKYKLKLEIDFHGDFWQNRRWLFERWLNIIFLLLSKFTVPRADAIRVMSAGQKDKLVRAGIEPSKIRVIATIINLEKLNHFDAAAVQKIKTEYQGRQLVLFVGRLVKEKNVPLLLRAFTIVKKRYSQAALLIVGEGQERGKFEKIAKAMRLENDVFFIGRVDFSSLPNYYYASYMVVLPSDSESFGMVLVEANACRRPVVATATTGAREIITDGYNGFLTPIGDSAALAEKIVYLLKHSAVAAKMGENGRKLVWEKYSRNFKKIAQFWQDTLRSDNN